MERVQTTRTNNKSSELICPHCLGSLLGFEIGGVWSTPIAMGYLPGFLDQNSPEVQIFVHERLIPNEDGSLEEQFYINHVLMRPRSSGLVRLQSLNPTDPPLIDPKFFSDPDDLERLVDGAVLLFGGQSDSY